MRGHRREKQFKSKREEEAVTGGQTKYLKDRQTFLDKRDSKKNHQRHNHDHDKK